MKKEEIKKRTRIYFPLGVPDALGKLNDALWSDIYFKLVNPLYAVTPIRPVQEYLANLPPTNE